MQNIFYDLLRVTVGNAVCLSHTPSAEEWDKLYAIAKKQSLVGVCFAGVQHLRIQYQTSPEALYLQWMGMAAKIQQRNEVVNRQCAELQTKLSADGLRSCILKGQGVAKLYGKHLSTLRQSGDIDLWVDASREKVLEYMMLNAPTKDFDQKHIHYKCFENTDVEAHWIPVKLDNPAWDNVLEEYFESEREGQFSNIRDGLYVPTNDFQLVHQLLHIYVHYVYEGVGLRQMMDLYFAQKACANGSNGFGEFQKGIEVFKKLGLMKYVAGTQWVLQEVFGMDDKELLCPADEKEGKQLLDEIMIGGNFGLHDERNHVKNESFFHRFMRRWKRKFRMIRFDPMGTILMPYNRIKLEIWMQKVRKQYGINGK